MSSSVCLDDVLREYLHRVEELYSHYLDSRMGFARNAQMVRDSQRSLGPSARSGELAFTYGVGNPNDAAAAPIIRISQRTFVDRNAEGGRNHALAGQHLLVLIYAVWEHEYRGRVAAALGLNTANDLKIPIMGDLRFIRNDVLHNHGVLSEECEGKLEVLKGLFTGPQVFPEWEQLHMLLVVLRSCMTGIAASGNCPPP